MELVFLLFITQQVHCIAPASAFIPRNDRVPSMTELNTTATSATNMSNEQPRNVTSNSRRELLCTMNSVQNCNHYIKNIFLLYTRTGGWVLLGIIISGIGLQAIRHILAWFMEQEEKKKVKNNQIIIYTSTSSFYRRQSIWHLTKENSFMGAKKR